MNDAFSCADSILEYIRGHTGMKLDRSTSRHEFHEYKRDTNSAILFKMTFPHIRIDRSPNPTSVVFETAALNLTADVDLKAYETREPVSAEHPDIQPYMLSKDNTGLSQIRVAFLFITHTETLMNVVRTFYMRDNHIHRII